MTSEFFLRIAQRCRELIAATRSELAREQLQIWVDEFEARAVAAEHELQRADRAVER